MDSWIHTGTKLPDRTDNTTMLQRKNIQRDTYRSWDTTRITTIPALIHALQCRTARNNQNARLSPGIYRRYRIWSKWINSPRQCRTITNNPGQKGEMETQTQRSIRTVEVHTHPLHKKPKTRHRSRDTPKWHHHHANETSTIPRSSLRPEAEVPRPYGTRQKERNQVRAGTIQHRKDHMGHP